jgi:hypothetical protein
MRKLTRLWQALERIPGLCDITAYWEHHCGVDYPLLQPHLRVTDEFGARYPCPIRRMDIALEALSTTVTGRLPPSVGIPISSVRIGPSHRKTFWFTVLT